MDSRVLGVGMMLEVAPQPAMVSRSLAVGAVSLSASGVTSALGADAATYVNFTGESNAAVVRASYPPDTYRRLVDLKNEYDPTNLFRLNQNIAPSV